MALLLVVLLVLGCAGQAPKSRPSDAGATLPPSVDWAGCAAVRAGPICEVGPGRVLTFWVSGSQAGRWVAATDKGTVSAVGETDVEGGTRLTLEVPRGAGRVRISDVRTPAASWSMALRESRPDTEVESLLALGRSGRYEEAIRELQALRGRSAVESRGLADAAIGRMALALGDMARAEPALRASMSAAEAEGRISDVVKDGATLVWALVWFQQRFADARLVLERIRPFALRYYPEGRAAVDFHTALLAASTGDVRAALDGYRAAHRTGTHLIGGSLAEDAAMELSIQLIKLGRIDEALTFLKGLPAPTDSCSRASWALNLAWTMMERAKRDPLRRSSPEVLEAIASAEQAARACPDPARRLLAAINAADYELDVNLDGPISEASMRSLRAVEAAQSDHTVLLESWRADIRGRWLMRQGRAARALGQFAEELRIARGAGLLEETFRAWIGEARALRALGRRRAAISGLKAAQEVLQEMLLGIPLAEGRGGFLGGHDSGVRYLVTTLVEAGAPLEALMVARRTRAAELALASRIDRLSHLSPETQLRWDRALGEYRRIRSELEREAQHDWTVPRAELVQARVAREARAEQARHALDEAYELLTRAPGDRARPLSSPAPDELFLAFFPAPRGWYAFAHRANRVTVRQADEVTLAAPQATKILAMFGSEWAGVKRVRLFPYGASDRVDWEAVSWKGRALLASFEVEYGLDVPSRSQGAVNLGAESSALIVANPSGDLPAATVEGANVAQALGRWRITRLDGPAATREAALSALSEAQLFHYAGHAEVGEGSLSSALLLRGGARLELGDLLASGSVPELVVISACEAAGTATSHPSLLGLAQAFVAAGTFAAVAPTREIGDSVARAFVKVFYDALLDRRTGQVESVQSAFRRASLSVYELQKGAGTLGGEDDGWTGFRLLVP